MSINLANCVGCAQRREVMRRWMQAWQNWAKNPLGPRPGSTEWLKQQQENDNAQESTPNDR